jgi:hypothetical protein
MIAAPRTRAIQFVPERVQKPLGFALGFRVDDVDFLELVRAFELPFAIAEGHSERAGEYGGRWWPQSTTAAEVAGLFLGRPDPLAPKSGQSEILSCTCRIPGCWPLLCRIEVRRETVEWSSFEQPHRRPLSPRPEGFSPHRTLRHQGHWRYESFGPFVFSRIQYEAALDAALRGPT